MAVLLPLLGVHIPYQKNVKFVHKGYEQRLHDAAIRFQMQRTIANIHSKYLEKWALLKVHKGCFCTRLLVCTYRIEHIWKPGSKARSDGFTSHHWNLKCTRLLLIYTHNTVKMSPSERQNGCFGTCRLVCTLHIKHLRRSSLKASSNGSATHQLDFNSNKTLLKYIRNTVRNEHSGRV